MKVARQTTLRDHTVLSGVGVHSGLPVTLTLHPADAGTGFRFIRTRIEGGPDREIPADMLAGAEITAEARAAAERLIKAAG